MVKLAINVWCFASVVPIRKLLSAQLSKTLVNRCFLIWNKQEERPATAYEIDELVNGEDKQLFMSWTDILPNDKEKGIVNLHIDSGKEDVFELRFLK